MKKENSARRLTRADTVKVYANARGRRFVDADEIIRTRPAQRVLEELETLGAPSKPVGGRKQTGRGK